MMPYVLNESTLETFFPIKIPSKLTHDSGILITDTNIKNSSTVEVFLNHLSSLMYKWETGVK